MTPPLPPSSWRAPPFAAPSEPDTTRTLPAAAPALPPGDRPVRRLSTRLAAGVAALTLGSLVACASSSAQGGLTSVPGLNSQSWGFESNGRDPIANGHESCPRSGQQGDDPLPNRYPPCPEAPAASARPAPAPPLLESASPRGKPQADHSSQVPIWSPAQCFFALSTV